ncbi:MAG TPA: hypothetical protein VHM90_19440 [Phycisphaerae bacterium]|nr:hypothetical protein [Phycisphaerae bacterium]
MRQRFLTFALAPVVIAAGVGLAQVDVQPATSIAPTNIATTAASAPRGGPASMQSAESALQGLLHQQGTLGTTGPANPAELLVTTTGPALGSDGMLREGQQLLARSGRLKKDEAGNSVFVFDERQEPHYPPMQVFPSHRLERMEDVAFADGRNGADTLFAINGEVSQYRGKNYLYVTENPYGMPTRAATTATAPASAAASASAPAASVAFVDVPAPDTPVTVLLPETTVIAGRDGRFVKDVKSGQELITFYSDGKRMFDPPMGLLPCKFLAYMEEQTEMGNKPIRYKVSGEVTLYRGKNYLYLRTAWEVKDLNQGIGNFAPGANAVPSAPKPIKPGG